MVNYDSIAVQNAIQNGAVFPEDDMNKRIVNSQPYNDFMNPPQPPINEWQQNNIGDYGPQVQQFNMQPNMYNPYYSQPMYMNNSGYPNGYPQPFYGQQNMVPNNPAQVYNVPIGGYGYYGQPNMYYNPSTYYQPGAYPQYNPMNGGKINPFIKQQPQQQMQTSYTVKGFNPFGTDAMFSTDQIEQLKTIDEKYQELNAEKMDERYSVYDSSPYNYYGYMNSYYVDPILMSQYNRELQSIKEQAEQNQFDLTMRLAKGVHYYLGDVDVDNEEEWSKVEEAYKPRTYEIPQDTIRAANDINRFRNMVDTTEYNKQQVAMAHARVTAEHNKIVSPDSNMMDFFNNAGMILWQNAFDELQHREKLARRNRYSRRDFIRYLKGEGKKYDNDIKIPDMFEDRTTHYDPNDAFYSLFPNLDKDDGWSLSEDGTLKLSYPDRLKANRVVNEEESNYEQQRLNFANAVYNKVNPRDPRNGGGFVNV